MGLTTDLFYNLTVEKLSLKSVKVGIRDSHLRGKAVMHFNKEGSQTAAKGIVPLVNDEVKANINFAAGPIPVNIQFSIPTGVEFASYSSNAFARIIEDSLVLQHRGLPVW